jgi:hypothetical protein
MLDDIISDADHNLMEAIGYVNAITFIIKSFDTATQGAMVDDALYSMALNADNAAMMLNTARGRLEDVGHLPPVDKSNNGEN